MARMTREEILYLKHYEKQLENDRDKEHAPYLKMALDIARQYHTPGIHIGDLIQEGNLAMLEAKESLDERGDLSAFRIYQPAMAKIFEALLPIYGTEREQEIINERFPECESISVDYALMEKAEELLEEYGIVEMEDIVERSGMSREEVERLLKIAGEEGLFDEKDGENT